MRYLAHQLLTDLQWLLEEQEYFVCDLPLSEFLHADWRQRLARLSVVPNALIEYMAASKSHFLGAYFEQLFSFAVHQFTTLEVLAEYEQISASGKTLGEVDMLVREPSGRVLQLEIALKFYLEREDLYPHHWIGPNKHDSLTKKVGHARSHQLTILTVPEGKQWLEIKGLNVAVEPNLMIFGRHFYSISGKVREFFTELNKHSAWVRLAELEQLAPFLHDLQEARKPHWITPERKTYTSKQINYNFMVELSARFVEDDRPVLFSCRTYADVFKNDTFWLFVCPDGW